MADKDKHVEIAAMELLEKAFAVPSPQREGFISARSDVDEHVRNRALELLRSGAAVGLPLQTGGATDYNEEEEDPTPKQIGSYRILRQLGRGGMGAVYLGERIDDDFDHVAAIKLVKTGLLSDSLIERFRRERQLLAQLNHKHIARLYDGGETPDGAPYIIMEYVDGVALEKWLNENRPQIAKRLELFEQICDAVAFAHQNLIIHRDLTPSNVLVTNLSEIKLIDFGIAKPQTESTEDAQTSSFSGLSLTPGYAAPERSKGASANTLTDIFSLGRILELLIKEYDSSELNSISTKACHDDPEQRYTTVESLWEDIRNFRDGFPVAAYSGDRGYRIRKFVVRQKIAVGAAVAIVLLLMAGLAGTGWAYNQAERARHLAEQRFEDVRDLATFQIFDLNDQLTGVIGNTAARMALAEKAQSYLTSLSQLPDASPALKLEAARGLVKLALITGVSAHPNFGEFERAKDNLIKAEQLLAVIGGELKGSAQSEQARVNSYRALILAHADSKPKEAAAEIEKATMNLNSVPRDQRDWEWMTARRALRLAQLETADLELEFDKMERIAQQVRDEISEWPAGKQSGYEAQIDQAISTNYLATAAYDTKDKAKLQKSLRLHLNADAQFARIEEQWPNDPITLYRRGWNAYYGYGAASASDQLDQAENLLSQARQSVDLLIKVEENDESLLTFGERLKESQASLFSDLGRHSKAISLQEEIIEGRLAKLRKRNVSRTKSDLAYGYAVLGVIARKARNRNLACSSWAKSEKLMAQLKSKDELSGYVENMRAGMQKNLDRCAAGLAVSKFEPLT